MNRLQARTHVLANTKRTDKVAEINSALDLAVAEVSMQALWIDLLTPGTVTLLSGTSSIALASDVDRVSEIRVIDGLNSRPLIIRPKTWIVGRYPNIDSVSASKPSYGYLEGETLHVVPSANQDYEIRYTYCRPHPALAGDSDEILIRHGHLAVIAYATSWIFESLERSQDAATWEARYLRLLATAKKANNNSVITHIFDQGIGRGCSNEYWLDPFCRRMP